MPLDEHMLAVIEAVYEAAMDESLWPEALQHLADATDSQAATLWVLDRAAQPRLPALTTLNFDPDFTDAYLDHMVPLDPTVQYLVAHPDLSIVHDGLYLTDQDIDHHAYYDWHTRHTDARYRLVVEIRPAPAVQAGVALHRTRKAGRYQPRDIERFTVLHSQVERALMIGFQHGSLGTLRHWTTDLLDRSPLGMLLLDQHKRLIHANSRAEAIACQDDGIQLARDGLVLSRRDDHKRLQHLIAQALGETLTGVATGGAMRVSRPSGKRPYFLLAAPVTQGQAMLCSRRPTVSLTLNDPEGRTALPIQHLQSVFGLTQAEAHLASELGSGLELRGAAEKLGIRYGTARARLADIFQKTQTRRQAELIQLMLAILTIF